MKKIQMIVLALVALGMSACGGTPSKEEACGCLDDDSESFDCETTYEFCSFAIGGVKGCKKDVAGDFCD